MRHRSTSQQQRWRAIIGLVLGNFIAIVAAIMTYLDVLSGKGTLWILVILAALPLIAWGSANLAKCRGYPSAAAYGLFAIAFVASGFIGLTRSPLTLGFAFLFMGLMPPVVLLALPRKSRHLSRW
jgi:hypothetical protein